MHVPITTAVLALVTLAIIALRFFWWRLPARLRSFLVYAAVAMVLLRLASVVSRWSTTSDRMNAILDWCAVAGYELIIILFTLYPPKWLTAISAMILMVPVFASSIITPLTRLFDWSIADIKPIGHNYICEKSPWDADPAVQNTGVDLIVFYRPPFAPFLRHRIQRAAFNDEECNSAVSFATVEPDRRNVRFHCPASPSLPNKANIELVLPIH